MRRQVITGGAIVVISVASAAAYNIVQGRWFNAATSRSATQAETVSAASPTAENQAEGPRAAAVGAGWPVPGGTTEPAASASQSTTVAQAGARPLQAAPPQAATPPAAAKPAIACANPNAMGVSRVVEIDTGGGPGFGSQHFKTYDF